MRRSLEFFVVLVAGCTDGAKEGPEPIEGPPVSLTAEIVGTGTYASIRGSAAVSVATDGLSFTASIAIENGIPASTYPWHVHFGTCGDGGGIVGGDVYPYLIVDESGRAAKRTLVALALDLASSYSVNVHRAPDDLATIIACGDLVTPGSDDGGDNDDDDDDRPDY